MPPDPTRTLTTILSTSTVTLINDYLAKQVMRWEPVYVHNITNGIEHPEPIMIGWRTKNGTIRHVSHWDPCRDMNDTVDTLEAIKALGWRYLVGCLSDTSYTCTLSRPDETSTFAVGTTIPEAIFNACINLEAWI